MLSGSGLWWLGPEDRVLEPSPGTEAVVPAIPGDLWLEPILAVNSTLPEFSTPQRKQLLHFLLYLSKRGFLPCKKARPTCISGNPRDGKGPARAYIPWASPWPVCCDLSPHGQHVAPASPDTAVDRSDLRKPRGVHAKLKLVILFF